MFKKTVWVSSIDGSEFNGLGECAIHDRHLLNVDAANRMFGTSLYTVLKQVYFDGGMPKFLEEEIDILSRANSGTLISIPYLQGIRDATYFASKVDSRGWFFVENVDKNNKYGCWITVSTYLRYWRLTYYI